MLVDLSKLDKTALMKAVELKTKIDSLREEIGELQNELTLLLGDSVVLVEDNDVDGANTTPKRKRGKRKPMSESVRRKMAESQRLRWERVRKEKEGQQQDQDESEAKAIELARDLGGVSFSKMTDEEVLSVVGKIRSETGIKRKVKGWLLKNE